MIYLGCDPGSKGAFACLWQSGIAVGFYGMPMTKAKVGEVLDCVALWHYLREFTDDVTFVIEESNVRPGEGLTSGAKLAWSKGVIWGQAVAAGFSVQKVAPGTWKREFGLIGCDKKASRAKACELFPGEATFLAKARPDYSEALLLATWAKRKMCYHV